MLSLLQMLLALCIWDVKETGSYVGKKQESLCLPGITPGKENREGLLLLERVDL